METEKLTLSDLTLFTGTENWYRHPVVKSILYSDGIRFMISKAAAYWLIDEIAFGQYHPRLKNQKFQLWTLCVNLADTTAPLPVMTGTEGFYAQSRSLTPTSQ